jgi:hypothetical protein
MTRRTAVVVALAAVLMTVPPSATAQDPEQGTGETDEITFYGHVFRAGLPQPSPANTEAPIGEDNYGLGFGIYCQDAGPAVPGNPATGRVESCDEEPFNKLALFSTAGPVDVQSPAEFEQKGAYAQLHNERGQTKPILLDESGTITASLYGAWDSHGWPVRTVNPHGTNCAPPHPAGVPCLYPYWGWDPGVFEGVVMKSTLYHADLGDRTNTSQAPPVDEAVENGKATIVAQGQWGPDRVMNGLPGSPNAFHWQIDLGQPQTDTIPRSDDFFLVHSTYQENAGQGHCLRCPMRWYSGEFFPSTFQMPVENAFTVERVIPNFANGKMAMLGILNTPWGSYDTDPDSVELTIEGPQGNVAPTNIERYADFSTAHGGHFEPVNLTWIWDYRADDVAPGDYEVTVYAENLQNSASASCTASFSLEQDGEKLVPGDTEPARCGIQGVGTDEAAREAQQGVENPEDG